MPASVQGAGVTAPNKTGRVSGLTELDLAQGFPDVALWTSGAR